jgi:hypothetical protein
VLDEAIAGILDRLPPAWSGAVSRDVSSLAGSGTGLVVRSPAGEELVLVFESRRVVEGRDVAPIVEVLEAATRLRGNALGVVAARYLPPTVRERLRAAGLSYVDATGNLRIVAASPGLFLQDRGSDADPWRGPGRPRGTLKGAPAAKVVRALLDLPGTWSARDLATFSRSSVGTTYRVLDYLEREGLIERTSRGSVEVPEWRKLLEAWARDYDFLRAGSVSTYIAPRGLPWLMQRVAASDGVRYAVTGSLAVPSGARYAPARSAMIYVEDAAAARTAWDLRPTESGQNVLLCEAPDSVAFDRATLTNDPGLDPAGDVVLARPAQVAVDLMASSGRGPEEAQALLEWMGRDESTWRS